MTNKEIHEQKVKEHWAKLEKRVANAKTEKEAEAYRHFANLTIPCCHNEKRGMNGGCETCGDPCF